MATQLSIVGGGRKRKPTYTNMINAQTPYLYPMMQAREDKAYRDKQLALEETAQARNEEIQRANLDESKKQNKTANMIKLGQLGITTGFGIAGLGSGSGGTTTYGGAATTLKKAGAGIGGALKQPSTYVSGGIGALGGQYLGKDKSSGKKALIGMGIGAGAGALSGLISGKGFDPYQTIVSGVLGGLGSLV
jgi:hypothetical protein